MEEIKNQATAQKISKEFQRFMFEDVVSPIIKYTGLMIGIYGIINKDYLSVVQGACLYGIGGIIKKMELKNTTQTKHSGNLEEISTTEIKKNKGAQ